MTESDFVHRFVPARLPGSRTLLLLHGTGGNEDDLLDLGQAIDPGAALLSPRGKVLENGAPRFFRRLAEGVFDEADVAARAKELASFVEAATTHYGIEAKSLVAVGYSNGANIAAAMLLRGVAPFARAVLLRAMLPLSDVEPARLSDVRVLISAGRIDPIARPPIAQQLADALRAAGAEVDLVIQPNGHELAAIDVETTQKWLLSL